MPYHLRITRTAWKRRRPDIVALGKSADWIEETIAAPRRQGRDIFVEGHVLSWDDIDSIRITETDQAIADQMARSAAARTGGDVVLLDRFGRDVTEQFLTGLPGSRPDPEPSKTATFAANRKAVMVIYGHDGEANTALFDWLRSIGLQPQEWSQLIHASGSASPYIGQVLDHALRDVQAVIAFFTPDERVTAAAPPGSQGTWRFQARPNVLIEAGMALSTHPTRTILVVLGSQELPSDLSGRHYVRLSHTAGQPLHDLAGRLRDAGCEPDTTGTDWLNPARFPDRDTITPPVPAQHTTPAPEPPKPATSSGGASTSSGERREQAERTPREDYEARQVLVTVEHKEHPGLGHDFNRRITLSAPHACPVKQVEGCMVISDSGTFTIIGFGHVGDEPSVDEQRVYYSFWAEAPARAPAAAPIMRWVDWHGNRYYQYRHYTQRFRQNTDWMEAVQQIDTWIRTGPNPD